MIITLGFILSLIRVWTQFGKGLADHCELYIGVYGGGGGKGLIIVVL